MATEANTIMVLAQELDVTAGVREVLNSLVTTAGAVARDAERGMVVTTLGYATVLDSFPLAAIPLLVMAFQAPVVIGGRRIYDSHEAVAQTVRDELVIRLASVTLVVEVGVDVCLLRGLDRKSVV